MATSYDEKRTGADVDVTEHARHGSRHDAVHEIPLDLDDPHKAALEDNPEKAETITLTTFLAIAVCDENKSCIDVQCG